MKERLFDPLGMKDTYFHLPPEKVHRFAEQYIPNPFSKADIARMEKGGTVSESGPLAGEYLLTRACIAYMESTVIDIYIPPPSFKHVSLSLSRISFYSKNNPKQVFFLTQ